MRTLMFLSAALLLTSGCATDCDTTCRKLVRCDEVESSAAREDRCAETCLIQENLYEQWEDQELLDALDDAKRCVYQSTCEEIAEGACYDETLYAF